MEKWISVKRKLPTIGHDMDYPYSSEMILVSDGENVYYGQFEDSPEFPQSFIDSEGNDFENIDTEITHWMPLPNPPTKGKSGGKF